MCAVAASQAPLSLVKSCEQAATVPRGLDFGNTALFQVFPPSLPRPFPLSIYLRNTLSACSASSRAELWESLMNETDVLAWPSWGLFHRRNQIQRQSTCHCVPREKGHKGQGSPKARNEQYSALRYQGKLTTVGAQKSKERGKGAGSLQTAASQNHQEPVHCARSPGSLRAIGNYLSRGVRL